LNDHEDHRRSKFVSCLLLLSIALGFSQRTPQGEIVALD